MPRSSLHQAHADGPETSVLTMRELGKLTAEQVANITEPVAVTNHGLPVAWLVPLSRAERRHAQMVAGGRLRPGRPTTAVPLPPMQDGPTLSELLVLMRQQDRT